ncbi:MAG TPA: lipid-A-disaccharide synthase [Candidatus Egerieousia sp.]|nr:lipid-A-disaccharide synthase [Candidatus Egerieousia sp.]HPT06333.1 lipid-A-disaccharide synthase [Candidatus Egerieousia sp.]
MKYYIIAGEASGDLHGSNLIRGLKQSEHDCEIRCWGGDLMQDAGGTLVRHYKDTAIMGFLEVVLNLNKILNNIAFCREDILKWQPDLVILIDYPGFNFRIAKFAHNKGFKVFYYIAPKIWAWKESRGKQLQRYVDRLFIIFPFEIDYFKRKWNIDAIYRGNPLLDSIDNYPFINESKEEFCKRSGLVPDRFIALLAGSRKGEIMYLLPRMLDVIKRYPGYKFLLATAPSVRSEFYTGIIDKYNAKNPAGKIAVGKDMFIIEGKTYSVLKHSEAAIINSGTASLEAAIIGIPQVVCYGSSEITYQIAKHLVKLHYISLANLILDKQIFIELIQHTCTPELISKELYMLLNNKPYVEQMKKDYAEVRRVLGGGGASKAVAEAIIEEYDGLAKSHLA